MKTPCVISLIALGLFAGSAACPAAAEWTRFRGPAGDGIATGAQPPLKWSGSQNLAWKTELPGPGASSPIRAGNRIFVTCYSGYGTGGREGGELSKLARHLVCVDATSGKILWNSSVPGDSSESAYTRLNEHGYASQTPVTDGEKVFVFFGKSGVLAFDLTGKQLWQVNVGKESGRQGWGSATSLMLYKNSVIVNAADESQSIRALDKVTGKELWKAEGSGMTTCYNTPTLVNMPGDGQELVVAVQNEVWGLNPDNGKLRWYAEVPLSGNLAASIVAGDGVVYAFGGNRGPGTVAVRVGGKGDVTKTHVVWTTSRGPDFGTPVLHEGHLYYANSRGVAVCINAKTGEQVYEERLQLSQGQGRIYASPILADGKLFITTRTAGTVVLAAKPAFEQLAENPVADDRTDFSATPMLTGNQLFLRSNRALYCFAAANTPVN